MAKPIRRVRLEDRPDVLDVLRELHIDRVPRLIERDGEPIAIVLDPADYAERPTTPTSRRRKHELIALAGAWRDLDADRMIEDLHRARNDAPPSPVIRLDSDPKS